MVHKVYGKVAVVMTSATATGLDTALKAYLMLNVALSEMAGFHI